MSNLQGKRAMFYADQAKRRQKRQQARRTALRVGPSVSQAELTQIIRRSAGEKKGMDTSLNISGPIIATTSTNADSFTLNLVRSGNGSYNRVGKKIFNKSIRLAGLFRFEFSPQTTTSNISGAVVRMVVVWDKQPSGTLPAYDDVFGTTTQDGTEATGIFDPVKYDNMNRFQILRDVCYDFSPEIANQTGGTTNVNQMYKKFDEFIKLGNKQTVFSGDSSPMTIADISTGGLYVYFRSNQSAADQSDIAIIHSYARLRYSD